jgi:hypothetical protein
MFRIFAFHRLIILSHLWRTPEAHRGRSPCLQGGSYPNRYGAAVIELRTVGTAPTHGFP